MATRDGFLAELWSMINGYMRGSWITHHIQFAQKQPNAPFADLGAVLVRLRSLGATDRELSIIARAAAYQAAFGVLTSFGDPGLDGVPDETASLIDSLHEDILSADPSGREGRPGSAP